MTTQSGSLLIGIFRNVKDAEDAIVGLKEQGFAADRIGAAFAAPATTTAASAGPPGREPQAAWFGKLRRIFNESGAPGGDASAPVREYGATDFEASLTGFGIPSARARELAGEIGRGGAIVTVNPGGRERQATEILERYHGHVRHEDATAEQAAEATNKPQTEVEPGHIQLFGEVLRVHKQRVDHGEVRVRKESVTEMRTVEVPVTREQLVVERSERASPGERGGEIRIPLNEEQVSVDKETALLGEYRAGKRETTGTENVEGQVRREKLVVDDDQVKKGR